MLTTDLFREASLVSLITSLLGTILILSIFSVITTWIYNAFFHPLASFPGPKSAGASRLWYIKALVSGRLPFKISELHEEYGDVVRVAPNELSFNTAAAYKDIYSSRAGKPEMAKDDLFYTTAASGGIGIINAKRDRHGALRRLLSHGFSEKALRDQEPVVQQYMDLFLKRVYERCDDGNTAIDMVRWFNYFTFDVIGDLTFGELFGCLEEAEYHPWVATIFESVKISSFLRAIGYYPSIKRIQNYFVPARLKEKRARHRQMTQAKVQARKERKTERADFLARFLEEDADASAAELLSTSSTLIVAGSETTATLMSGVTYLLLKHPDVLQKLTEEIRTTFKSEQDIDFTSVNGLKYMLACLDEGLRYYPPVSSVFPRNTPPGGDNIGGTFVPEDTVVSIVQWATYRASKNFSRPNEFHPERFLGDERFADDDKSALQPFSMGARNCLGRNLAYVEMRMMFARFLWNFDLIKLDPSSEDWIDDQKVHLLWEKGPLNVHLKPRFEERPPWLD